MMTNDDRAHYGQRATEVGTADYGANGADLDGVRTNAVDTIANILHHVALVAERELGVEEAAQFALDTLLSATRHFEAEVGDGNGDDD